MISKTVKCKNANRCEDNLVFRFMQVARWVALALLWLIGSGSVFLQYLRQQELNWVFFAVCGLGGSMLFWIGRCLMNSECQAMKRAGRCPKNALNDSTSVS